MTDFRPIPITRTSWRFNVVSATLAFFVWGGWAYHVNRQPAVNEAGASPLISGLIQGVASACIALMMVRSVAWIYHRFAGHALRMLLPALITVSIAGCCLATAHLLAGTSDPLRTIAPALTVAFGFNVFTTNKIRRSANHRRRFAEGRVS